MFAKTNQVIEYQDFDDETPTKRYPRCNVCSALFAKFEGENRCNECTDYIWIAKAAAIKEVASEY